VSTLLSSRKPDRCSMGGRSASILNWHCRSQWARPANRCDNVWTAIALSTSWELCGTHWIRVGRN